MGEWNGVPMKLFNRNLSTTKSMADICKLVGEIAYDASSFPAKAHTTAYYRTHGPFADSQPQAATGTSDKSVPQQRQRDEVYSVAGDTTEAVSAKRRKCES